MWNCRRIESLDDLRGIVLAESGLKNRDFHDLGLACAIIALRKLNKLIEKRTDVSALAQRLKRSAIVGVAVCGVALTLNAISFYLMMPVVLEMMESGDYAGAVTDAGIGAAGSTSTWG